jgi:IS5 family transposase
VKYPEPYEFGVKVSVATTLKRCKGGQFVTHVQALPGNPYDGHTLARVIPAIEALLGNTIERLHTDAGYRGHNAPPEYKFKVYTAKQKRRVTPQIKREMRRAPPSSPSSVISRTSTAWTATTSPAATATPTPPSSLPSATTSAA